MPRGSDRKVVDPVLRLMAKQSVGVVRNLARNENNITHDLDAEIKKSDTVPVTKWNKFRVKGQRVLHGKYVLMLVVALCVLDCCLVITELILDIHAVKDALSTFQHGSDFHGSDYEKAPSNSSYDSTDSYLATERAPDVAHSVHRRASADGHPLPLTMEIAHGCHFASVAILGVLLVYVIFKVVFFGKEMFSKKLEMFDAFVVLASFALDLAFLDGLTNGPIENTAFILSFFVPWRVLRVVNSLVVAILDHEHYKLVLIYKSKKRVEITLDEVREELHEALNRIRKLKDLSLKSGVDEWKVNLCLVQAAKNDGKKNALSSFASFTFGAMTEKKPASKKLSNGISTQNPIRVPQLLEEEKTENKVTADKEKQSDGELRKRNNSTVSTETGHPKSLSGDSALSLSLDTEQSDSSHKAIKQTEDPDAVQTSPNNVHTANQSTVVNIPEKKQNNENKSEHTAIEISLPVSDKDKAQSKDEVDNGGLGISGHVNPAFISDDVSTKL
ncbi:uncharacterized protein LOC135468364 [Liolophura sinensis]|uniref:uncharacterized protein LOC135468364 n=1 Tax=Liolophura sinensis TaxID=3198878 RepID=UPI0031587507